jgi:tetratricopeptide (TPR) repeat protein
MLVLLISLLVLTPAEQNIASAQKALAANHANVSARCGLAAAYTRRAREADDPAYLKDAEEALAAAPQEDFTAAKLHVEILLAKRQWRSALEQALALNRRVGDDVPVYGYLTEAYTELGRMKEAEEACQWMLNLRPGNTPALLRTAYLREKLGETAGAIELLNVAFRRTPETEVEERAWILVQLARLQPGLAKVLLEQALQTFPGYPHAVKAMTAITGQSLHAVSPSSTSPSAPAKSRTADH